MIIRDMVIRFRILSAPTSLHTYSDVFNNELRRDYNHKLRAVSTASPFAARRQLNRPHVAALSPNEQAKFPPT